MRPLLALLAAAAVVAVVPAQAQEPDAPEVGAVPAGAVAVVGESEISRRRFDRWLRTAAIGARPRSWASPVVPDPPRHRRCVAALRKRLAERGRPPGPRRLRRRCTQLFDRLMPEVMTFLLEARWIALEVRRQGIAISERRVMRAFREQKRTAFPTERAYRRSLRRSGFTQRQTLYRVRTDVRQQELMQHVTRSVPRAEQEAALERFSRDFRRRYEARTRCARGFEVRGCRAPG